MIEEKGEFCTFYKDKKQNLLKIPKIMFFFRFFLKIGWFWGWNFVVKSPIISNSNNKSFDDPDDEPVSCFGGFRKKKDCDSEEDNSGKNKKMTKSEQKKAKAQARKQKKQNVWMNQNNFILLVLVYLTFPCRGVENTFSCVLVHNISITVEAQ